MSYVDLHTHSTASDGSLSPAELMRAAKAAGLAAIALSDHDTIEGLAEAGKEAAALGVELIPAVELSLSFNKGSLHMLGYMFDPDNATLKADLDELERRRNARNDKMLEKLAEIGIEITAEELAKASGGGQTGRPHFAKLLIEKGHVKTFNQAFDEYLGKGKPGYVPKTRLEPEEGLELINRAGGVAVLAHPKYCGADTPEELEGLVERLAKGGLMGIECLYTDHNPAETSRYQDLARRYNLVVTGGTDWHGEAKPNATLGFLPGKRRITYSHLQDLKDAKAARDAG